MTMKYSRYGAIPVGLRNPHYKAMGRSQCVRLRRGGGAVRQMQLRRRYPTAAVKTEVDKDGWRH